MGKRLATSDASTAAASAEGQSPERRLVPRSAVSVEGTIPSREGSTEADFGERNTKKSVAEENGRPGNTDRTSAGSGKNDRTLITYYCLER